MCLKLKIWKRKNILFTPIEKEKKKKNVNKIFVEKLKIYKKRKYKENIKKKKNKK